MSPGLRGRPLLWVVLLLAVVSCSAVHSGGEFPTRQLLVRPRQREGRRPHTSRDSAANSTERAAQQAAAASQRQRAGAGTQSSDSQGEQHDYNAATLQNQQAASQQPDTRPQNSGEQSQVVDPGSQGGGGTNEQWNQQGSAQNQAAGADSGYKEQQQQPKSFTNWDGQPSWEWDNPKTLYFEPVAGLGNRLRALSSAVVVAREMGVGLKVIWREEVECGAGCSHAPPFNSTWQDLFSYPKLRLAPNFPGSNYSVHWEDVWLRVNMSIDYPDMPPVVAGYNCNVHKAQSYSHLKELIATSFTHVHGEQVLCVKSDMWLTKNGESDGRFFFRLLQPSPPVRQMINDFKASVDWDNKHFVGVHIRRTDLAITAADGSKQRMDALISLSHYVDRLRKLTALAPGTPGISYFIATDDADAEKIMRSSFEDGMVFTYPKTEWSRSTVGGIQQALVDVMLLAECPVLIGTYYSSYSETAKLIGWPYYIQIGNELSEKSVEAQFEGLVGTQ